MNAARTFASTRQLLLATLAVAPAAYGQFSAPGEAVTPSPAPPVEPAAVTPLPVEHRRPPNRWGLSARFGFNIGVEMKNVGGASSHPDPDPVTGLRQYDDGFVGRDGNYPNNNGMTRNWGYDYATQEQGTQLFMHSSAPASNGGGDMDPDMGPLGFELTYARELQRNQYGSWGLELGAGWCYLSAHDNGTASGQVFSTVDSFYKGNTTLPAPPFAGSPNGQNAVIDETPVRTQGYVPGTISGSRNLHASLYSFRLGPYVDYRLTPYTSLQLGAGAAVVLVDSRFSFDETTTTAYGAIRRSGNASETEATFGPYLMGQFITEFAHNTHFFAGVQFYMLDDTSLLAGSKQATIKMDEALFVHAGISFGF